LEIRQNAAQLPTRPIAFVVAFLALLALAITGWSVLRTNAPSSNASPAGNPAYAACSGLGPDAQERCVVTIQQQQSNAETTHGH
jgi:Na+-transporting methylmalonyl-CoA/oxaloacetate decarboxylase gamma subunit